MLPAHHPLSHPPPSQLNFRPPFSCAQFVFSLAPNPSIYLHCRFPLQFILPLGPSLKRGLHVDYAQLPENGRSSQNENFRVCIPALGMVIVLLLGTRELGCDGSRSTLREPLKYRPDRPFRLLPFSPFRNHILGMTILTSRSVFVHTQLFIPKHQYLKSLHQERRPKCCRPHG